MLLRKLGVKIKTNKQEKPIMELMFPSSISSCTTIISYAEPLDSACSSEASFTYLFTTLLHYVTQHELLTYIYDIFYTTN